MDTSQLILTAEDIFESKRVACMVNQGTEMFLASSSPINNLLTRIYNEKTYLQPEMKKEREIFKSDRCLFTRDSKTLSATFTNENTLTVGSTTSSNFWFVLFSHFLEEDSNIKIWISPQLIYEFSVSIYYSLRHAWNKKVFAKT